MSAQIEIVTTEIFDDWLRNLRDMQAYDRIAARLRRFALMNFGDIKSVGDKLYEARIDYGVGYRLYYTRRGALIIIMLCGGDKSSQKRDIAAAKDLAKEV